MWAWREENTGARAEVRSQTVEQATASILNHGERIARDAITAMPDGEWIAESKLDNNGITRDRCQYLGRRYGS